MTTGDAQQFKAEAHEGKQPKVTLLWMTPDPLGAMAAMAGMYEGKVIRDLSELSHDDRMRALDNTKATHLRAPMEAVKLHFLLENVDRAFTHQLVRQRTAVYSQESLRFAVPEGLPTSLPPSLEGTRPEPPDPNEDRHFKDEWRWIWDQALRRTEYAYHALVEKGMPAEEARGLLPHATLTRIHYVTDLRNLLEHAGNRLCIQAQFHWRTVFQQIAECIRNYPSQTVVYDDTVHEQFGAIADLFKPICYQLGRCPFQATFDRECTIRERVNKFEKNGVSSDHWEDSKLDDKERIDPAEWLTDPAAARK
jgi:thymidylate synthase ThyX